MKSSLYKLLTTALALFISAVPVCSYELDHSIDEEIRKNYTPTVTEQNDLPPLPEFGDYKPNADTQLPPPPKTTKPTTPPPNIVVTPNLPKSNKVDKKLPGSEVVQDDFTTIKIRRWTTIKLKSNSVVSDYLAEGARVSFTTTAPIYQKYVTIPTGTQITARVTDSHQPQLTGNGGLVVLKIETINFKGRTFFANGKVTKANKKNIFFNNIKGKRKYWTNVINQIDKGQKFYDKTRKTSTELSKNPFGSIISPIPTIVGTIAYALNFVGSPIIAIGYKGDRISIPAGSEFEIKILDDVILSL